VVEDGGQGPCTSTTKHQLAARYIHEWIGTGAHKGMISQCSALFTSPLLYNLANGKGVWKVGTVMPVFSCIGYDQLLEWRLTLADLFLHDSSIYCTHYGVISVLYAFTLYHRGVNHRC
jgi:hypothetical protein